MKTIERAPRPDKVAVVSDVESRLSDSDAAILTEYRGIPVARLEVLRRALRGAGGEYKIYKNTLVRRAAAAAGLDGLDELLTGPTGIAFVSGDVSTVAKVLRDFAVENPNLVVKGGLIGRDLIDARGATALAELPSREVLLAQIAGMLAAPMQRFASLLNALPQNFAYALSALIDARPDDGAAAAPAPAAESESAAAGPSDEAAAEEVATDAAATDAAAADAAAADAGTPAAAGDSEAPEAPSTDAVSGE